MAKVRSAVNSSLPVEMQEQTGLNTIQKTAATVAPP